MLREICAGQWKCSATQPSQAVATVSEKHMTANQSSVFTTPRRRVGSENAPSTAHGTASSTNSESPASSTKNRMTVEHASSIRGTQMCGAWIQARQRQMASSASGQVGHRYHGRSRSVRAASCRPGMANDDRFQVFQLRIQYSLPWLAGIHQARIRPAASTVAQSSQRLHFQSGLRG